MSAVATPTETVVLPKRGTDNVNIQRKTVYVAGEYNTFTFEDDDNEQKRGYLRFDAARLIRLSARPQPKNDGAMRIIVRMEIVLDGLDVGLVDDDGNYVPHPLVSEPRYVQWQDEVNRPKRVRAQQWVQKESYADVVEFANYLRKNHRFSIRKDREGLANPENSQRTTHDLFQVTPITGRRVAVNDWGVKLDAFEVSINPSYIEKGPGFSSFYQGLTEQQNRIEEALEMPAEEREQRLIDINNTLHYVGGVHFGDDGNEYARSIDVGMVELDELEFAFYDRTGEELDEDDVELIFGQDGQDPADDLSVEELSKPTVSSNKKDTELVLPPAPSEDAPF